MGRYGLIQPSRKIYSIFVYKCHFYLVGKKTKHFDFFGILIVSKSIFYINGNNLKLNYLFLWPLHTISDISIWCYLVGKYFHLRFAYLYFCYQETGIPTQQRKEIHKFFVHSPAIMLNSFSQSCKAFAWLSESRTLLLDFDL